MKELYGSFINFQKEFKGMKADASNPFFKSTYITLDGILETVRPLLVKNGLAVIQNAFSDDEDNMCVKTILIHETGQTLETETMKMRPQKDDAQQRGSVITYMKRYQLGALLGICESIDDDANLATHGSNKPKGSISDKQAKRLYTLASKAGYDSDKINAMIWQKYKKRVLELSKEEYDSICSGLESSVNKN